MAHISGHDRSQTLLFPESVDDSVGRDNPVRFIDAFVDGLLGFRNGCACACVLANYITGSVNRVG